MNTKRSSGRATPILSFAVVFMLAANVSEAKYSGGTGEPNNPYQIATPNDLNDIGNHPEDFNDCFIFVNDINMAGFAYTTALIAPDIDNSNYDFDGTSFTGIFDGNDCNICNLTIDTEGAGNWYLGLFGRIEEPGRVKNLGIEDVNITGGDYSEFLGGLCGENDGGTIKYCYATGSVSGGYDSRYFGGLCGYNDGGMISNSYAIGSVSAGNGSDYLGSLCGDNDGGTISNCYASGSVNGAIGSYYIGGLCGLNGLNYGSIINCYATGSVGGDDSRYIGGLCGKNSYGTIINCYATGPITGEYDSDFLGGLCGFNSSGTVSNCYATGSVTGGDYSDWLGGLCGGNADTITNCYATSSVTGGYSMLGGLCGYNSGAISNCYFLEGAGPDNGIGSPLTDQQMKQQSSFDGWDFVGETVNGPNDIWTIHETVDYPKHVWNLVNFMGWYEVNLLDYAFLANHWQDANCGDANDCDGADLDFSDMVDWDDLKIFCDHWLEGAGP